MTNSSSPGRIGFASLLTLVFITLKLCNVIHWSWLWVLSPMWIVASLVVFVLVVSAVLAHVTRPKTPQEKVAAALRNMSSAIRRERNSRY